jgi:hypothetical protein
MNLSLPLLLTVSVTLLEELLLNTPVGGGGTKLNLVLMVAGAV